MQRSRIDNLLKEAVERSVVVTMTAGTGYGKTKAVSMFLEKEQAAYRPIWVRLTEMDNLTTSFWNNIIQSVSAQSEILTERLSKIEFPERLSDFEQFLQMITEQIEIQSHFVVVFDDLHLVYNDAVLDFIQRLIFTQMDHLTFILLSRSVIDLNVAQMYERGILSNVAERDLRFTLEEVHHYFAQQGFRLSEDQERMILQETEGWALAVSLLCLEKHHNRHDGEPHADGMMRYVYTMFERDIYRFYSREMQDFMVKLSLLDAYPVQLMCEIAGLDLKETMDFVDNNLFMIYDPYTRSCQIHNMFLQFLREKQQYLEESVIMEVYRTAGAWYLQLDMRYEALRYYRKCRAYETIWDILSHYERVRLSWGRAQYFLDLLEEFPCSLREAHPEIRLYKASLLFNNLRLSEARDEALALKQELERREDEAAKRLLGEVYIELGLLSMAEKRGDFPDCFAQADQLLPGGSQFFLTSQAIDFGHSIVCNDLEKDELERMLAVYMETLPTVSRVMNGFGHGLQYLARAEVEFFRADLSEAKQDAYKAIYMGQEKGQHDIVCSAYFLLIRIYMATGMYQELTTCNQDIRLYVQAHPEVQRNYDMIKGWFYCMAKQPDQVATWIVKDEINRRSTPPISMGREKWIKILYHIKQQQYYEAIALAENLQYQYRINRLNINEITVFLCKLVAEYHLGNTEKAVHCLNEAYEKCQKNDMMMLFIEHGNSMRAIIDAARKSPICKIPQAWLDMVYAKASTYGKRMAHVMKEYQTARKISGNEYNLTPREKEILEDLCQGLSRSEIALARNISVNTVKSMIKTIYGKIGALNLADAVRIAMTMRIHETTQRDF
ncbi:MAG: LuxR C-terminal-related transcriptional regulator [Clostridiales bacterium]|nr:LuxR C-terminal-related transcriptional regulator [Clostridiales bacterium]